MMPNETSRRALLQGMTTLGGAMLLGSCVARPLMAQPRGKLHIACNQYDWHVFYARDKRDFNKSLDSGLADVAKSGMDGFEPGVGSPAQIEQLAVLLKKHGLQMRSVYTGSTLYDADQAEKSIDAVLAVAQKAKSVGTTIIVTNPSPLRTGGQKGKTDDQLKCQAAALDRLGSKLREIGLVLAYHTHDVELKFAAREFHHMMLATDPKNVSLCLDCHWVYRGAGNSAVALFDMLKLYGSRVAELHLRQSADNIWTEAMGDGDIDYAAVAKYLAGIGVKPLLVLEQAPEAGTPKTMDGVESHRRGREYLERVFAGL